MIYYFIIILIIYIWCSYNKEYYNKDRFLIFKATGGLFHMINALQNCSYFAKKSNRILIIDTYNHSAFNHHFHEIFYITGIEYYTSYDVIPKNITTANGISISKLSKTYVYFNYKKDAYYFNDPAPIKLRNLPYDDSIPAIIRTHINSRHISTDIKKSINIYIRPKIIKQIKKKIIKESYIGIHFRNTDKKSNINDFYTKIQDALDINPYINILFLATDDYHSIQLFKNKFSTQRLITFNKIKEPNIRNIHYLNKKVLNKYNMSKKDQIIDVLIDVFLLYKSTIFIPSGSGVSKYVSKIRDTNNPNMFNEN